MAGVAGKKTRNVGGQGVVFVMQTLLDAKVVLGKDDVPGVADNIEHLAVARIEVLMALHGAGPWKPIEGPFREGLEVGEEIVDIGEVGIFFGRPQVRH
jgi:hypothetical protein